MWFKISQLILRNRITILVSIFLITLFFGYFAFTNIKMDNTYGTMLPKDSQPKKDYELLKKSFGGTESLLIFAIETENIYSLEKFNAWYDFGKKVSSFDAIDSVFSEAHIYNLQKDTLNKKFFFDKVVKSRPETQEELDSLRHIIRGNPFFDGLIYNSETNASLMMAFVNEKIMSDMKTAKVLFEVEASALEFEPILGKIRVSGMPHIRVAVGKKLEGELGFFIALSIGVTSLILFIFFRSIRVVAICISVVFIGTILSLGTIAAFGYKLSILMVLIPPLVIVISIPNCIYLITKYHQEIKDHGVKIKALSRIIQKIGVASFLTNLTTALGFGTFIFTNSERLFEFGVIASINIMMVFILCLTVLPIILSYSKVPQTKHLKHLEKQWLAIAVEKLEYLSMYRRRYVYIGVGVIAIVAFFGIMRIKTTGNITGDLPQNDQITTDLKFIEKNFGGSIPFDLLINTKDTNSFYKRFEEIENVQKYLAGFNVFSKSLSAADGVKLINMAYSGNDSTRYVIPSLSKLNLIRPWLENSASQTGSNGFLDSTKLITRITMQIEDIGSYEIQEIIDSIAPVVDTLLNPTHTKTEELYTRIIGQSGAEKQKSVEELCTQNSAVSFNLKEVYAAGDENKLNEFQMNESTIYSFANQPGFNDSLRKAIDQNHWDVMYTGTSVVASNGTQYLVTNLFSSLAIAIVLIGLIMAVLFRAWRMVLISLVPNFIPLITTAAIMGYAGIPMKPSTLLVFSIAFGISVDDTIHFLAKFRQELKAHEHDFRRCVLVALRETGASMIYTSIILFFSFLMFTFSEFGGTKALGLLISLTLGVAMFSNLIVLPTLLLWMDKKLTNKALREPLLQLYNEEEDIELDDLEIEQTVKKYEEEDAKQNPDGE
jgi:predicted RND superfamily exporter protein